MLCLFTSDSTRRRYFHFTSSFQKLSSSRGVKGVYMLAGRSRRSNKQVKGEMNPLLHDADTTQAAATDEDNAKSSLDDSSSSSALVPHHVKLGFFLAGLFNNMSFCVILAGAKEVAILTLRPCTSLHFTSNIIVPLLTSLQRSLPTQWDMYSSQVHFLA